MRRFVTIFLAGGLAWVAQACGAPAARRQSPGRWPDDQHRSAGEAADGLPASGRRASGRRDQRRVGAGMLFVLAPLLFAACTVGPNYQKPQVTVPADIYGVTSQDEPEWLKEPFTDPVLRSLIDEAMRNGFDARIAAARVEEARARYGIAGSQRFPEVFATATGGVGRQNGETGAAVIANLGASWEADLWGRIPRLNEAARAQYLASEEGQRAVRLALVAEVAAAYFDLRELDAELDIARRNVSAFQDTFDLFNRRLRGGTASGLETSRAEALLANASAQIPLIERNIVATENEINVLTGRVPGPIARGASLAEQTLPAAAPAGAPASLLLRRPDVRAAEQQLIAANANIGVAQAAFYPNVSLGALLSEGRAWRITADVFAPIFNAGRLRNQRRVAVAQFEIARTQYEAAVNDALADVSTAFVAYDKLAEAEAARERGVRANQEAVRLANLRYSSGLSAYFEVLDAMEQLLAAENNLARTRRDRLVALVQLYRALGGGF